MGMKRFMAFSLVIGGLALPACAQRGGVRGGSVGHGNVGFSAGPSRAFAPSTRYSLGSAPRITAGRAVGAPPSFRIAATNAARRPGYPGGPYRRPPFYGVGIPYGLGWLGPNAFAYAGPGFYDGLGDSDYSDSGYPDPGYADPGAQANYPAQPGFLAPGDYPAQGYSGPPYAEPPAANQAYRPVYGAPPAPAPEPESTDAVTLVFKDGRPSQQIHNYLLTRSTLYVRDQQRHEIPVDELDLPATQKLNRAAGVEFQLPGGAK
jgi:hypothetical protein